MIAGRLARSAAARPQPRCAPWRRGAISVLASLAGCVEPPSPLPGQLREAVIYGDDTRRDVYAAGELGQLALRSTVAFVSADHLMRDPAGRYAIVADTLGASNNLCPGEAFFSQPAAATCSGVLIGDRLVLTAGHCVRQDATCDDRRLVFDYAVTDPDRAIALDAGAVYTCKSIPVRMSGVDRAGRRLDHAVIELDRPVSVERHPVALALAALPPGSAVAVIGHPAGLPVKIDVGAHVLYARPCRDYFTLDSDTFEASSGSGVFDERAGLIGVFVRGGADYQFVPERSCAVSRQISQVSDPRSAEQAGYLAPVIAALCATGRWSARLCAALDDPAPDVAGPTGACAPDTADAEAPGGCAATGGSPPSLVPLAWLAVLALRRLTARRRLE